MSYDRDNTTRIYVGNLPMGVEQRDVEQEFARFGKVLRCDIKRTTSGAPFAFIEYEDPRDARDAISERDGYDFDGSRLRVEIPFNARDGDRMPRRGRGGPPRKGRFVVEVRGLPPSGSWQDLKDHMREAGELGHADVFRDGTGEVSFFHERDMLNALEKFDGSTFRSHEGEKAVVSVREKFTDSDGDRAGGGGYGGRYRSRSPLGPRGAYGRSRSRSRDGYDRRPSFDRGGPPPRMGGPPPGYGRDRSYDRRSIDRYDRRGRGRSNDRYNSRSRSPPFSHERRSPYHGERRGSPPPRRSPPQNGSVDGGRSPYPPQDRCSPHHDRRGPQGYGSRSRSP